MRDIKIILEFIHRLACMDGICPCINAHYSALLKPRQMTARVSIVAVALLTLSPRSTAAACGPTDMWDLQPGQEDGCRIEGACLIGLPAPYAMCAALACTNSSYNMEMFSLESSQNCEFDRFVAPFTPSGGLCGTGDEVVEQSHFMQAGSIVAYITDDDDTYPGFKLCADTSSPTMDPTGEPSQTPTLLPTVSPTHTPTAPPTVSPTHTPTAFPTVSPTRRPSEAPTIWFLPDEPTVEPSTTPIPETSIPTAPPTPVTNYPSPFEEKQEEPVAVSRESGSESNSLKNNPGLIIAIVVASLVAVGGIVYGAMRWKNRGEGGKNPSEKKKVKRRVGALVF